MVRGFWGQHCPSPERKARWSGISAPGNHLGVSSERRALSPNRSPTAPEHRQGLGTRASLRYRSDTQRSWLYTARAPAAASSRCRRSGQTILQTPTPPPHNMAAAAAGTRAGAWERIGTESGTRETALEAAVAV